LRWSDSKDPLLRIAIILGPGAFSRDKACAAHEQLTIGWLLKWQER